MQEQHAPHLRVGHSERGPGEHLTEEEVEFGRAIDAYRRKHGRPFPTWHEVLAIAKGLGYRKVAKEQPAE